MLKYLRSKQPVTGPISCAEMKNAEVCVFYYVQPERFGKELQDLTHNGKVSKSSTLLKLTPVFDSNGLIVIRGRLSEASISQKSKVPVILPSGHKVRRIIIMIRCILVQNGSCQIAYLILDHTSMSNDQTNQA